MKKLSKKIITETLTDVSPHELEGELFAIRNKIQEWIDDYGPTARLDWDAYFQHAYDPSPSPRFNILNDREETDDEFEKRIAKERNDKEAIEARERAELARLQAKFKDEK